MFTNKQLIKMIVPLFIEQFLLMSVGIIDTFIISSCGEAAVSGVSLVNQFSNIFIMLFTALAAGGAVVVSQYIGKGEDDSTTKASSQLLMFSTVFALILSVIVLIFHKQMLSLLFGKVEADVMQACITYLKINTYSYVFLAIYNAGAALYRSMGKTKMTMYIQIIANVINVIGNIIGVYYLHAGVAGVAWPTLIARAFSAVAVTYLCFNIHNTAHYKVKDIFAWHGKLLKSIFDVAVPNGVENGVFQAVKVALSSVVALFGTYQIAANGVAQSIWSLAALLSSSMAPVFITVIGQCMGAGDIEQAKFYFKKLLKMTLVLSVSWNLITLALTPVIMRFYSLAPETKSLIIQLVIIHNIANGLALPLASPLGSGLRATGDVKFTMVISIISTLAVRLLFSYILAIGFNMGVIGIALAMCMDWIFKGIVYFIRYKSNKWTQFKLI